MLEAALWGAAAGVPLLIGAWVAVKRRPSPRSVGLVAAFGAGALLSAVSYELVADAVTKAAPAPLAASLALGSVVYWAGDRLLSARTGASSGGRGRALFMGATLDGVPESFILGLSLASGGELGIAFFVAVAASNFPEGMASAAALRDDPEFSPLRIMLMWAVVVGITALSAALGAVAVSLGEASGAYAEAFAAGALLTMLVDDLIPEASEKGGFAAGLLAVVGFAVAFGLHQIG